ncbi:hypothetical protein ACHQM5_019691 [Ranunculus cassubicifolius]
MAKAAVHTSLPSNSFPFERGVSKVQGGIKMKRKRKTPSELRDEQTKRRNYGGTTEEPSASLLSTEKNNGEDLATKKPDTMKTPRYIDTRVNEVYPVKKSSNRLAMQHLKEKAKNTLASKQNGDLNNLSATSVLDPKSQPQLACSGTSVINTSAEADSTRTSSFNGRGIQNTFQKVSEISAANEKSSGSTIAKGITNLEALKTLGTRDPPAGTHFLNNIFGRVGDHSSVHLGNFSTEFQIPGQKIPLDLTLKTSIKLVSSSSVKWCHRLLNNSDFDGMTITSQFGCGTEKSLPLPGNKSTSATIFSKSLHSWTHPQSSLPPSIISALTVSAAQGDMDFLSKRQQVWEDSFRNLYYMLRKNRCNLFYVCTPQFVAMFTGGDGIEGKKQICHAYVSQSTRGLRSLLREQDITFSMPLCPSEAEHISAEDLVELSEIEKGNLGQTRRSSSSSDVADNSPQSLLAFNGNESVHGLYDFLLNYRSFLSSLMAVDVPVLYAPVLFRNASISVPEVKCKEMRRTLLENSESSRDSFGSMCYSIEIKDTFLPPWIVSGICSAMGSENKTFEASFITNPDSIGLNVALDTVSAQPDSEMDSVKNLNEDSQMFGVSEAVVSPFLRAGSLKSLKYLDDSYTVSLLPI